MTSTTNLQLPDRLPVLALKDTVLFPGPPQQLRLADAAFLEQLDENTPVRVAVTTADDSGGVPAAPAVVGTSALLRQAARLPDGGVQLVLQPLARIRLIETRRDAGGTTARVEPLYDVVAGSEYEGTLAASLYRQFIQYAEAAQLPEPFLQAARGLQQEPGTLADLVAATLPKLSLEQRRQLLAETTVERRLETLGPEVARELAVAEMGRKIHDQVRQEMGQTQREHYLREQLRAIQKELGDDEQQGTRSLRERVEAARLPAEARREAERELNRLESMPAGAAEASVARTYVEWILELPWGKASKDRTDLARTRRVLDEDHEGLERVKERILEYVAVRKLRGPQSPTRGQVLCLVGPPGVGKTSLGRSVARALGRKFARLSLGGVRDEAEIRGHRRTYVGAMPGRLVQALKKAGTCNPVIQLDEIDKVGADHRGDPSSALLEVLDPEQNHNFVDHYLDVPVDLSQVVFLATANRLDTIPAPLRDRMEILQLSGYPEEDKLAIARKHLLPRQLKAAGIGRRRIDITDDALRRIIRGYTREAGLRNLERELATVARKIARRVVEGGRGPFRVTAADVPGFLGPEKLFADEDLREEVEATPGMVAGLAWTAAGGEVMHIEASRMGGEGLRLTGQLGDVMKESAQIAMSYVRAHAADWNLPADVLSGQEVHVHLPSGAVPKDGPSAGVALTTALVSLVTDTPVRGDVAMTGEVTLRGRVLPVGGIEEKVLAARRAGMSTVILPRRNAPDLEELPAAVREDLDIVLVDHVAQVLEASLTRADSARQAA